MYVSLETLFTKDWTSTQDDQESKIDLCHASVMEKFFICTFVASKS